MNNEIYIGALHVTNDKNLTRVSSDVKMIFDQKITNRTFFYEVENRWSKYLVSE